MYRRAVSWFVVVALALAGLFLPAYGPVVAPVLAGSTTVQLWIGQKEISVNGQTQSMDVAPFIQNGRTLVPVRFVSEALGAKVDWIDANQEIVIVLDAKVIGLWVGKDTATVNGVESKLEAPPIIQDSRTFVPVRFVSEGLGAQVDWLAEDNQVTIAYSAPQLILPTITDTVWHYVVMGDSEAWGFHQYYATSIAKDLGSTVEVISRTDLGQDCVSQLKLVKTSTSWRADLAKAEIITFESNPTPYLGWYMVTGPGTGPDHEKDFSDQAFAKYKADMSAIADEILTLRKGQPTLIRTQQFYCPIYSDYKKWGILEEIIPVWARINQILAEVATEHGFLSADIFSAFNGANHQEDPRDKGWIGGDGEHTSLEGQILIADVFRRLGYEFIVP
ncbi:MAG: copper amine oxidase N-terminal domain-containing protein [Coprothermobacterota bacterium]|nr:copper amine oxidase N-terminal domain-containing protein [Coprothermobacterota bacterium]